VFGAELPAPTGAQFDVLGIGSRAIKRPGAANQAFPFILAHLADKEFGYEGIRFSALQNDAALPHKDRRDENAEHAKAASSPKTSVTTSGRLALKSRKRLRS
jgi:hypothetical protein